MNEAGDEKLLHICTWFVSDKIGEETDFPQMGIASSRYEFQRVYWQCIWLFFQTANASNPQALKVLFVDDFSHPLLTEFRRSLEDINVRITVVAFTARPPKGFTRTFGNQLYIVDIIRFISKNDFEDNEWLICDSDCLILDSLAALACAVRRNGILTLDLGFPADEKINGLTQIELGEVGFELGLSEAGGEIKYFGGEFFAASGSYCTKLIPLLTKILEESIRRWHLGKKTITEEAHLLSLAYRALQVEAGTGNRFIRRIWTTFKYSNTCKSDLELPIWHVPAEKRLGFGRIYAFAMRRPQIFRELLCSSKFRTWAGKKLGIPRRTLTKACLDLAMKIRQKGGEVIPKFGTPRRT